LSGHMQDLRCPSSESYLTQFKWTTSNGSYGMHRYHPG
jgi:hypothetical protein